VNPTDFIKEVGFPIFVAVVLLYQVFRMDARNRAAIDRLSDAHQSIIAALDLILHKEGLK
jgi:hypothetical protein